MLGKEEYFPGREVVDISSIRRYAQAISDLNPLYLDEEYAKKSEYGGIIAPPTFIFDVRRSRPLKSYYTRHERCPWWQ